MYLVEILKPMTCDSYFNFITGYRWFSLILGNHSDFSLNNLLGNFSSESNLVLGSSHVNEPCFSDIDLMTTMTGKL